MCFEKIFAQNVENQQYKYQMAANYSFATIFAHHPAIEYLIKNRCQKIDISLGWKTFGEKSWQHLYNLPIWGVGISAADFGNPEILGKGFANYLFLDIPILKNQRFEISYRTSAGISYVTKIFDKKNNFFNIAIGTNTNVYFDLAFLFKFLINKQLQFYSGFSLTHYSNGRAKTPNQGINLVSFLGGINFDFAKTSANTFEKNFSQKSYGFSIFLAGGLKHHNFLDENRYFVASCVFDAYKILNAKRQIGAGIDIFYDGAIKDEYSQDSVFISDARNLICAGFHLSHELIIHKFYFSVQPGFYFYSKKKEDKYFYQRIGLKYRFSEHFFSNISLKFYLFKADFIEWGIGYCFEK